MHLTILEIGLSMFAMICILCSPICFMFYKRCRNSYTTVDNNADFLPIATTFPLSPPVLHTRP